MILNKISRLRKRQREKAARPFLREVLGHERLVVADIGAANGLLPHWSLLTGVAKFFLFEPSPESYAELKQLYDPGGDSQHYKVLSMGLSKTGGPRKLYLTNISTGSSLLKPKPDFGPQYAGRDYFFPMREIQIETLSLEQTLEQNAERSFDLLKLDVQGAELEILEGLGSDAAKQTLGIELEIGMPGGYENQPQFADIQAFMDQNGLELFDLRPSRVHRFENYQASVFHVCDNSPTISARLWEVDAVYFKKPDLLIAAKDASAFRKLIAVYCTYNFYAEAYHQVGEALKAGLFNQNEARALQEAIKSWHKALNFSMIYGQSGISRFLRKILHRLTLKNAPRWAQYTGYEYPSG